MRIWLISPKPWSLLNNTKMLQIYIQRVLNPSFKVICISGIIYLQIILLRMNCLKGFCQTHSITRLIRLRRLGLLDCLQLCHDRNDQKKFYDSLLLLASRVQFSLDSYRFCINSHRVALSKVLIGLDFFIYWTIHTFNLRMEQGI